MNEQPIIFSTEQPRFRQLRFLYDDEIIVDLFAGGGGMSVAIEQALGRSPDIAINHDDDALSMHRMNHPQTRHFVADVFEVDPCAATQGRKVGLLHLSPDCRHHSQAAGGQPRSKKIRALTWVGKRWAGQVAPRVITLENVKQILKWGPLIAKRDKTTGRVLRLDGSVAKPGERTPIDQQYLIPDPKRAGRTWEKFVRDLEALGYRVEYRTLCAADYGAPTIRERLFLCARRDGMPITWPEKTNFKTPQRGKKRWLAAASCIDWTIPCPSIFERKKPLADATLKRIAKGIKRFVIDAAEPFLVSRHDQQWGYGSSNTDEPLPTITASGGPTLCVPSIVPIAHYNGSEPVHDIDQPLRTITAHPKGGAFALCAPTLIQAGHGEGRPGKAQRWGSGATSIDEPLRTVTASGNGGHSVAAAYLMQANGGFNVTPGHDLHKPASTITNSGSQQQLVTAFLSRQFGQSIGQRADDPAPTITAGGGGKTSVVDVKLSKKDQTRALRTAAFLMRYYGEGGQWSDPRDPLATVTTKDRLALVTVMVRGTPYLIVDIGLRMLEPQELYAAQGFPNDYIITHGHDGRKFSKSAQVRMVGNSVSPPVAAALVAANVPEMAIRKNRRSA